MSNDETGAVDNDFDDAERDPTEQIESALEEYPTEIKPGDIVMDLIQGRPLYVRRTTAPTVADHFESEDFNLATYKAHPFVGVRPDDPVFECVFIPTKPQDIPTKHKGNTYDYPASRLARVPIEWLYNSDTHRRDDMAGAFLAALFAATTPVNRSAVQAAASEAFGNGIVHDALERAGFDPETYAGTDDDSVGDFGA